MANWPPGSDEGYGAAGSGRSGRPALPDRSARSSKAHTNRQQRFILLARRYEARSLTLADAAPDAPAHAWRSQSRLM
jgi:hypothetical protein